MIFFLSNDIKKREKINIHVPYRYPYLVTSEVMNSS